VTQEQLLGYLLAALDEDEHRKVVSALQQDSSLREQAERLSHSLSRFGPRDDCYPPSPGLARSACRLVFEQAVVRAEGTTLSRWRLIEVAVAVAVLLAVSLLFFPAISYSRFQSRLAGCQNNLMLIGQGISNYCQSNNGSYPSLTIPKGGLIPASQTASILSEQLYVNSADVFYCPASSGFRAARPVRLPSTQELQRVVVAGGPIVYGSRRVDGEYGFVLGFMDGRNYVPQRMRGRFTFAVVAEAPAAEAPFRASRNHDGERQNVWFEDGHVQFVRGSSLARASDDFFMNDSGQVGPGMHPDDAVIVAGDHWPAVPK
jgi:hypothetical protein